MALVDLTEFDYKKVGRIDAAMWRSYYNHQFFKLFWQLLQLFRNQLRLNWLDTLKLAYYAGVAAADYRLNKLKGVNNERVLRRLTEFYKVVSSHAVQPFDYAKAAQLELEWWDVHRYPERYANSLENSLAEGAAAIYNVSAESLKDYGRFRARAALLPKHEGDKQPNPPDWQQIETQTVKAWQSLYESLHFQTTVRNVNIPSQDLTISGTLVMPSAITKKIPAVIIFHGMTSSKDGYVPLAKRLAENGIAGLAVSMRGHGESEGNLMSLRSKMLFMTLSQPMIF